jgi:hypothetical protein
VHKILDYPSICFRRIEGGFGVYVEEHKRYEVKATISLAYQLKFLYKSDP